MGELLYNKLTHEEELYMVFLANFIIIISGSSKCCSEMKGLINISNNGFLRRAVRNPRHLDLLSKNEVAVLKFSGKKDS
jgi:hypothetical protein